MKRPDLSLCSRCGRCLSVCPTYKESGLEIHSPRGRVFLLQRGIRRHPALEACLRCGNCRTVCPNRVPLPEYLFLLKGPRFPLPISFLEGIRKHLTEKNRFPSAGKPSGKGGPVLFLSCGAAVLYPEATRKFFGLFERSGLEASATEPLCCGLPYLSLSGMEAFLAVAQRTLEILFRAESPLLTLCASCFWTFRHLYPLVFRNTDLEVKARCVADRVQDATLFIMEKGGFSPVKGALFHLPCHMREAKKARILPEETLLSACCGSVSPVDLFSRRLPRELSRDVFLKAPGILATACTGCYFKLKRAFKPPPEIKHWVECLSV